MKLTKFLEHLNNIKKEYGEDLEVHVMVEIENPITLQVEQKCTDLAVSKRTKSIIIIGEEWK